MQSRAGVEAVRHQDPPRVINMAAAPVFHTIASLYYPGYNLTQRGSHVVLEAQDIDSPFQLWYKDDYVEDTAGNPAFALINGGSQAALQADSASPSNLSLVHPYDRSKDTDRTTAWTIRKAATSDSQEATHIFSVALNTPLRLGLGSSPPKKGDGVAAILGSSADVSSADQEWNLQPFDLKAYNTPMYDQILIAKGAIQYSTILHAAGPLNNKSSVVAVRSLDEDGEQEVWVKLPVGGPLEAKSSPPEAERTEKL